MTASTATQSAVFGSFRELSPKSGNSAAVSDPYCTKITLPESHLGAHQNIFSAAIFRGAVRGLADGAKPGERTLVIPAHWQFAGKCELASVKIGWLTATPALDGRKRDGRSDKI